MTNITAQVLASTNIDSHGERRSRDQLYQYFLDMPDPSFLYFEHDTSSPPVARMHNKSFEQQEDGSWVIKADIDVLDEVRFTKGGGISISFTSGHGLARGTEAPAITILVDPQAFGPIEDYEELIRCSEPGLPVAVGELKRKGAESTAIMVLSFVAFYMASGFFEQVGADAYNKLKSILSRKERELEAREGRQTAYHFMFPMEVGGREIPVVLELPPGHLEETGRPTVSLDDARSYVTSVVGDSRVRKVSLTFSGEPPHWCLKYFIDDEGAIVRT